MRRWFAVKKWFPVTVEVMISVLVVLLAALSLSITSEAEGPALATISEVRYSDQGWGIGYNGNLVGRFTNSTVTLTRYATRTDVFPKELRRQRAAEIFPVFDISPRGLPTLKLQMEKRRKAAGDEQQWLASRRLHLVDDACVH